MLQRNVYSHRNNNCRSDLVSILCNAPRTGGVCDLIAFHYSCVMYNDHKHFAFYSIRPLSLHNNLGCKALIETRGEGYNTHRTSAVTCVFLSKSHNLPTPGAAARSAPAADLCMSNYYYQLGKRNNARVWRRFDDKPKSPVIYRQVF